MLILRQSLPFAGVLTGLVLVDAFDVVRSSGDTASSGSSIGTPSILLSFWLRCTSVRFSRRESLFVVSGSSVAVEPGARAGARFVNGTAIWLVGSAASFRREGVDVGLTSLLDDEETELVSDRSQSLAEFLCLNKSLTLASSQPL